MKLTHELLSSAPSYLNAISERELLLRGKEGFVIICSNIFYLCSNYFILTYSLGHNIPLIENLGVTKDLNDSIDLTDNGISVLGNFPKLNRLRTLLVARNKISHIHPTSFASSVPNLEMLVLSNNHIANLSDLQTLSQLSKLTYLSLVDNPVTNVDYYRSWIIWLNPNIRVLDFQKVKESERERAKELFGSSIEKPTALAAQILSSSSKAKMFSVGGSANGGSSSSTRRQMTEKEKEGLRQQLKGATSLAEISRIEQALKSGYF